MTVCLALEEENNADTWLFVGEGYGAAETDMHEAWLPNGLRSGDPEDELESIPEEDEEEGA